MPRQISVHMLPALVTPERLQGSSVVIIDVLRASTTIATALACGAESVIPVETENQAFDISRVRPVGTVLLGGERFGRRIDRFDLGNSPSEYAPERVSGRTIVFTTTNGTRALAHARHAATVVIGSFVNAAAICTWASQQDDLHLLCAGTDGAITAEDVLFAGLAVDWVLESSATGTQLNDQAFLAQRAWKNVDQQMPDQQIADPQVVAGEPLAAHLPANTAERCNRIERALLHSQGAKNLIELGMAEDIRIAAQLDAFSVLPLLNAAGELRCALKKPSG